MILTWLCHIKTSTIFLLRPINLDSAPPPDHTESSVVIHTYPPGPVSARPAAWLSRDATWPFILWGHLEVVDCAGSPSVTHQSRPLIHLGRRWKQTTQRFRAEDDTATALIIASGFRIIVACLRDQRWNWRTVWHWRRGADPRTTHCS